MEEVLLRFQHIGEEIFDSLDEKSLENCKKVCRTWQNFISNPNQKFMWTQIIKAHEENAILKLHHSFPLKNFISGPKPNWSKLSIQSLREFANSLVSDKDKSKKIEMFLDKYAELKVELNATVGKGKDTIFILACYFGLSKIANILITKSANLKIDLNARNRYGQTAFHYACHRGRRDIVAMMIEHAESLKLNFKIKDMIGETAFQIAKNYGKLDIVDLIKKKLPAGTF